MGHLKLLISLAWLNFLTLVIPPVTLTKRKFPKMFDYITQPLITFSSERPDIMKRQDWIWLSIIFIFCNNSLLHDTQILYGIALIYCRNTEREVVLPLYCRLTLQQNDRPEIYQCVAKVIGHSHDTRRQCRGLVTLPQAIEAAYSHIFTTHYTHNLMPGK